MTASMEGPTTAPLLSVIIPHYNDPRRLDTGLDAVVRSTAPIGSSEIIVVDNGSDIDPAKLAKLVGTRAKLIFCLEKGAGPARNAGVAASSGRYLAFIDSDCVATERWATAGLAAVEANAAVIGGHVSIFGSDAGRLSGVEAYEAVFGFDIKSYVEKKGFVGSGNMFVRRSDFDRVGGFRKAVSEDVEWSGRARESGLPLIFSPEAEASHPARADWPELVHKFRRIHREMFQLIKLKSLGRMKWLARTWLMPLSIVAHAPRLFASDKIDTGAAFRALPILVRLRLWRFIDGNRLLIADLLGR